MTPAEMQRTMEFILEHQAKFEVEVQQLFESQKELREADERLRDSQATRTAAVVRITDIIEENEKRTQIRSEQVDARFLELAEAQKATDERLSTLIHIVEDHVVRQREKTPEATSPLAAVAIHPIRN